MDKYLIQLNWYELNKALSYSPIWCQASRKMFQRLMGSDTNNSKTLRSEPSIDHAPTDQLNVGWSILERDSKSSGTNAVGLWLAFIVASHRYLTPSEWDSTIGVLSSKSISAPLRWSISLRIKREAVTECRSESLPSHTSYIRLQAY